MERLNIGRIGINPQIHAPSDLLAGAESFLEKDDPHFNRAAVLEAISALEAYVGTVIIEALKQQYEDPLIELLKEKTKMDFDSRLGILVPLATGQAVDRNGELWQNYKRCKTIRNKVTHIGSIVSQEEAKLTVKTVYDWLSFMGSTAEIDISMHSLKKAIEREPEKYSSYGSIEFEICRFFGVTKGGNTVVGNYHKMPDGRAIESDIEVEIGNKKVVIEIRNFHDRFSIDLQLDRATSHIRNLLYTGGFDKGVVLLLCRSEIPQKYEELIRQDKGRISIVPVKMFNN